MRSVRSETTKFSVPSARHRHLVLWCIILMVTYLEFRHVISSKISMILLNIFWMTVILCDNAIILKIIYCSHFTCPSSRCIMVDLDGEFQVGAQYYAKHAVLTHCCTRIGFEHCLARHHYCAVSCGLYFRHLSRVGVSHTTFCGR